MMRIQNKADEPIIFKKTRKYYLEFVAKEGDLRDRFAWDELWDY